MNFTLYCEWNSHLTPTINIFSFLYCNLSTLTLYYKSILSEDIHTYSSWGISSAGRALRWQRRGQGFEPPMLHTYKKMNPMGSSFFDALHSTLLRMDSSSFFGQPLTGDPIGFESIRIVYIYS